MREPTHEELDELLDEINKLEREAAELEVPLDPSSLDDLDGELANIYWR